MTTERAGEARPILYDIMLSHRDTDSDAAHRICAELEKLHFKVWHYGKDGDPGRESLYAEAKSAIDQSRVFLLLVPQSGLGPDRFWRNPRADKDSSQCSVTQLELLHAIESNGESWRSFQDRMQARIAGESALPLKRPIFLYYLERRPNESNVFDAVPPGVPNEVADLPFVSGFGGNVAGISLLEKKLVALFDKEKWTPLRKPLPDGADSAITHVTEGERPRFELLTKWEEKVCAQAASARAPHLLAPGGGVGFMLPLEGESGTEKYGRGPNGIEEALGNREAPSVGVERGIQAPLHQWFGENGPKFALLSGPQGAGKTSYLRWLRRVAGKSLLGTPLSREEQEVSDALQRRMPDGSITWPIPLWLDAEKLIERLERGDRDGKGELDVDAVIEVVKQIAGNPDVDARMEVRPYLVLVDGLYLLTAKQRNRLLSVANAFNLFRKGEPIQLIAAIQQSAMDDARDPTQAFAEILTDPTSGWDEIRIRPLSLTGMEAFLAAQHARDPVLVEALQSLIGRVERDKDIDEYLSTPLGLTLAVRRGVSAEGASLDGRFLLYELLAEFFSDGDAQETRIALGPVAAALVGRGAMEFTKQSLTEVVDLCGLDAATLQRVFERIKEGRFKDYVGPVAAKPREARCRFAEGNARNLFAADFLSDIAGSERWVEEFEERGIWRDIESDGSRWLTTLEILLVALVVQDQLDVARQVTNEMLDRRRRLSESGRGRVLWSLLLDVALRTPQVFDPGLSAWADLLSTLEQGYEQYRASWTLEARDRALAGLMRLERVRDRKYPEGVSETTAFSGIMIDGVPQDILVANAPVLVRHYERFILALERDSAGLARLFASDFDIEKSVIRWRAPSRWLEQQLAGPDRPVVDVTWHEAAAYCCWLQEEIENGREVEFGVELDEGLVIRLPAFDEWQQIKLLATHPSQFPSSPTNPLKDDTAGANCVEARLRRPSTVGLFGRQASGLFDFGSNVREWASVGTRQDRDMFALRRVTVLGVSYNYSWSHIRTTLDYGNQTHQTQPDIGFRWIVAPPRELVVKG
jgi:hypothetical protein